MGGPNMLLRGIIITAAPVYLPPLLLDQLAGEVI